jgi:hypothetical protein
VERAAEAPRRRCVGGETLLVSRLREGAAPDVPALDGPRQERVYAGRSYLVAVSPDARSAFVADGGRPPVVSVVDVASGEAEASLPFRPGKPPFGPDIVAVGDSGSWAGDLVVAPAPPHLAVFRVRGSRIELEQVLHLDPRALPSGAWEPRTDATGRHILVWGQLATGHPTQSEATSQAAVLECDRYRLLCVQGEVTPFYVVGPPRVAFDPSRP